MAVAHKKNLSVDVYIRLLRAQWVKIGKHMLCGLYILADRNILVYLYI
jgi:hypothetical protein